MWYKNTSLKIIVSDKLSIMSLYFTTVSTRIRDCEVKSRPYKCLDHYTYTVTQLSSVRRYTCIIKLLAQIHFHQF